MVVVNRPTATDCNRLTDTFPLISCGRCANVSPQPCARTCSPWSSGGVLTNETLPSSVVALVLPMGAHHLDLMFEDPADPPCVQEARLVEEAHIRQWIADAYRSSGVMV